jgi:catechol 2,3-dioxygenase-like lactoylglutathione lyase family enzyme
VKDVERSVAFYERAFGLSTRMREGITRTAWGELETGATTLAFTPVDQVNNPVMLPGLGKPDRRKTHLSKGKAKEDNLLLARAKAVDYQGTWYPHEGKPN